MHARQDVEVNGLSRKDVQTYALSAAGGFVGVAIAVSVWSVGTQTNSNYQDSGGAGPDKGTWAASIDYHAGDVVTDSVRQQAVHGSLRHHAEHGVGLEHRLQRVPGRQFRRQPVLGQEGHLEWRG